MRALRPAWLDAGVAAPVSSGCSMVKRMVSWLLPGSTKPQNTGHAFQSRVSGQCSCTMASICRWAAFSWASHFA